MVDEVDHRGEELPKLTKRSSSVNLSKLRRYHRPSYDSTHLATPGFWPLARHMVAEAMRHQFRSLEIYNHGEDPSEGPGVLAVCWHTAGLIDSMLVIKALDKRYAFAGRHDILTGPIIGWWGRRMGVQPLLRQAERLRGHVDDETATEINSSSMLTVACKLAYGQASQFLPEGHSHNESHLIRLRTGPMRSALNAAAVARELDQPPPVMLPVGLTFRDPHQWRSDVLIELGNPVQVPELSDKEHGKYLLSGEWSEPDKETTIFLRNEIRDNLAPLTPDAPNHPTWQSWLLLGHLVAKSDGRILSSWKEEVFAARAIRDGLRDSTKGAWAGPESEGTHDPASSNDAVEKGRVLAGLLADHGVDGRDLNPNRKRSLLFSSLALIPLLALLPFSLPVGLAGNGFQFILGQIIATRNSEAIDKRTTFQVMPTFLGCGTVRPIILGLTALSLWWLGVIAEPLWIAPAFVVLWLSTFPALYLLRQTLNSLLDLQRLLNLWRLEKTPAWDDITSHEKSIIPLLAALK